MVPYRYIQDITTVHILRTKVRSIYGIYTVNPLKPKRDRRKWVGNARHYIKQEGGTKLSLQL
jgi:hypothetical protein